MLSPTVRDRNLLAHRSHNADGGRDQALLVLVPIGQGRDLGADLGDCVVPDVKGHGESIAGSGTPAKGGNNAEFDT